MKHWWIWCLMLCACGTPTPPKAATPTTPPAQPQPALVRGSGGAQHTIFELAERIHSIDLAAHPRETWAAVGLTHRFQLTDNPLTAYIRVYDPQSGVWRPTFQLDTGATRHGFREAGVSVTIADDQQITSFWGGTPPDGSLWSRTSHDRGARWSNPILLAQQVDLVLDSAATSDGWIVVLARGYRKQDSQTTLLTTLIVREPSGTWHEPQNLPLAGVFGSIVVAGVGPNARVFALISSKITNQLTLVQRRIGDRGDWISQTVNIPTSNTTDPLDYLIGLDGLVFSPPDQPDHYGIVFSWTRRNQAEIASLISMNGQHWNPVQFVLRQPGIVKSAALGYEPQQQRIVVFYSWAESSDTPAPLYLAWRSQDGSWQQNRTPLVFGERDVHQLATAQQRQSRQLWLGWIEEGQRVMVRHLDLGELLPAEAGQP